MEITQSEQKKNIKKWEQVKGPLGQYQKAMATHSGTLAWKIPWTEEPGRLQSMGSLPVGHNWVTSLSFSLSCFGEGNGKPLQCSCLGNPRGGGAWWAAVYGVAQSQTGLKWLSSSSRTISSILTFALLRFQGEKGKKMYLMKLCLKTPWTWRKIDIHIQ